MVIDWSLNGKVPALDAPYFSHYNDGKDGANWWGPSWWCSYPDTRWCACKVTNEGAHEKLERNKMEFQCPFVYTSGKIEGC